MDLLYFMPLQTVTGLLEFLLLNERLFVPYIFKFYFLKLHIYINMLFRLFSILILIFWKFTLSST